MKLYGVSAAKVISSSADRIYRVIADYEEGHPLILPRPPFVSMDVVRGGFGAGTEIVLKMRVLGKTKSLHGVVSEPTPGRVIAERYTGANMTTTFTLEPRADDTATTVTIATDMQVRSGLRGVIERWLATRLLYPVYRRELDQLARVLAASPAISRPRWQQ